MLGLAFNVKLFEALVPVPAFVLFWWLGTRAEPLRARAANIAGAVVALGVVACSWLVFVSLRPSNERP